MVQDELFCIKSTTTRVTANSCECGETASLELPCRHIFAVRAHLNLGLYDKSLCAERGHNSYYRKSQRVFAMSDCHIEVPECISSQRKLKQKIYPQHGKFAKATRLIAELPSLIAEAPMDCYVHRFKVIQDLKRAWENNQEVIIVPADDSDSRHSQDEQSSSQNDRNDDDDDGDDADDDGNVGDDDNGDDVDDDGDVGDDDNGDLCDDDNGDDVDDDGETQSLVEELSPVNESDNDNDDDPTSPQLSAISTPPLRLLSSTPFDKVRRKRSHSTQQRENRSPLQSSRGTLERPIATITEPSTSRDVLKEIIVQRIVKKTFSSRAGQAIFEEIRTQ